MEDYKNVICAVNDKDDVLVNRDYSVTSLPAILDGELFRVIERNGLKISAKCCNCPGEKIILGTKTSTGNFLSHIKRVHPTLLEKARNKRTRVGLRKWPDVSIASQDNVPLYLTGNNSNVSQNEADNVIVNYIVSDMNPLPVMEKSPTKNYIKEFSKGSNNIVPSQKNLYSRNGSLWKHTSNKILPPDKNPNELRKRLLKLKREYYEIKRYLKFSNHPEWKYMKSISQSSHSNHIQEKKCDLDSLEVEIDTKHSSEMSRSYSEDKRNNEDNMEQSMSEFQRSMPEDMRNPEDNLEFEIGQMPDMLRNADGIPETMVCSAVEGREADSPSTSTSQLSDVLFSTSSTSTDEEKHSSPSSKRSKMLKMKGKYKSRKLVEAEKKSYELKWKKLQMEIEVAQSMKTLITSLADLVSRIQPPFPGQSSTVPNWTMPAPYSFVQNYPQPMPSSPVSQQCVCNNRKSSQPINGISSSNQPFVNHSKDSSFNNLHNNDNLRKGN